MKAMTTGTAKYGRWLANCPVRRGFRRQSHRPRADDYKTTHISFVAAENWAPFSVAIIRWEWGHCGRRAYGLRTARKGEKGSTTNEKFIHLTTPPALYRDLKWKPRLPTHATSRGGAAYASACGRQLLFGGHVFGELPSQPRAPQNCGTTEAPTPWESSANS